MVKRCIRIAEAGVRFPPGPRIKTQPYGWVLMLVGRGASQTALARVVESKAGAMSRQQARPRGCAQPEERDGASKRRGRFPPQVHKNKERSDYIFVGCCAIFIDCAAPRHLNKIRKRRLCILNVPLTFRD